MKPIELREGVYWVGAIDWNIRDFHGYATYRGTTYNAYLIVDDRITLVDTVKKDNVDELLARIGQVVDPKKIDQVVTLHAEMDHSGGLPRVMDEIGEDKPIFCSKLAHKNISRHFPEHWNYQPMDNGGQVSLGRRSLTMIETRMLHWPDSTFGYCPEERILFSSDAFGQHIAGLERFDDEVDDDIMYHAKKYYANILLPFSPLVLKLLEKVSKMGLDLDMVCPDHGIIWRKDPGRIFKAYVDWATQAPARKAVVAYDTMWQSTRKMAEAVVDGLAQSKVPTQLCHLRSWHRSDIVTEVQDAGALLVGSPTLNNNMFPTVADFLCYTRGLRPLNKVGAAFGSYGWSGESVKMITEELQAMKFNVVGPGVRSEFVPDGDVLEQCYELGRTVAAALPD